MFRNGQVPKPKETLVANTSIFERDTAPQQTGPESWKLGRVIGVLKAGTAARVDEVITVPGDTASIYWAQICRSQE